MLPALTTNSIRWIMLGLCIALTGCSSLDDGITEPSNQTAQDLAKPDLARPDLAKATPVIRTTAGQYHLSGPLEIAGPIEAPVGSINPWVICLKSAAESRFTVALFYKADTLASSHISTLGDHCDGQVYRSLPN